jgi:uncharacterized protein YgiM (DUF1202 family)
MATQKAAEDAAKARASGSDSQTNEKNGKLSFWDILKTPFMKYAEAVKTEELLKNEAADPNNQFQKGDIIKNWFKEFWYVPVLGLVLLIVILKRIR